MRRATPWAISDRPTLEHIFDEAANRRAVSAYPRVLLAEGTVTCPADAIDSVALTDQHGRLLSASTLVSNRLDGTLVFRMRAAVMDAVERVPTDYGLDFFRQGKLQFSDRGHQLETWTNAAVLPDTGAQVIYSSSFSLAQPLNKARLESWEPKAEAWGKVLFWTADRGWASGVYEGPIRLAGLLLVAGWLAGRAALYGLLDATTGWGAERYMRCISPLFILILVLAAAAAAGFLKKQSSRKPASQESFQPK